MTKATRVRRSKDELRQVSAHLFYEVKMLRAAAKKLADGAIEDRVARNALIESFGVHARVVIDFLYDHERTRAMDAVAIDFFEDPDTWRGARRDRPADLSDLRDRVNRTIAHLSYDRQGSLDCQREWPAVTLGNKILATVALFTKLVSPELLGSLWHSRRETPGAVTSAIMFTGLQAWTTSLD